MTALTAALPPRWNDDIQSSEALKVLHTHAEDELHIKAMMSPEAGLLPALVNLLKSPFCDMQEKTFAADVVLTVLRTADFDDDKDRKLMVKMCRIVGADCFVSA